MANRRMLCAKVLNADHFIALTVTARLLYVYLAINADDDGLVNSPKAVARYCGGKEETLDELVRAGYLIPFVSGVTCITHWCQHNKIRKDRYHPSIFQERQYITVTENETYTVLEEYKSYVGYPGHQMTSFGPQPGQFQCQGDNQVGDMWNAIPEADWEPSDGPETEGELDGNND